MRALTAVVIALVVTATTLVAQAPTAPGATQSGRGGTPTAAAPSPPAPPRDITGVWMMRNPPGSNRGFTNYTFTDPKTDPPALTKWGEEQLKLAKDSNGGIYRLDETNDPVLTKCYPPGVPRVYFHPYPFEIIQTPKEILQVFEYDHFLRRIKTDGRKLPEDPDPLWMGTSVGHWENNDFVVETIGFNTKTWLDRSGHAHSDKLKVTERFRRKDRDHLELDFTLEDPVALAKPWKATFFYELRPNWELGEISCSGDYQDFTKKEKGEK
jgi:hypothetical protein